MELRFPQTIQTKINAFSKMQQTLGEKAVRDVGSKLFKPVGPIPNNKYRPMTGEVVVGVMDKGQVGIEKDQHARYAAKCRK